MSKFGAGPIPGFQGGTFANGVWVDVDYDDLALDVSRDPNDLSMRFGGKALFIAQKIASRLTPNWDPWKIKPGNLPAGNVPETENMTAKLLLAGNLGKHRTINEAVDLLQEDDINLLSSKYGVNNIKNHVLKKEVEESINDELSKLSGTNLEPYSSDLVYTGIKDIDKVSTKLTGVIKQNAKHVLPKIVSNRYDELSLKLHKHALILRSPNDTREVRFGKIASYTKVLNELDQLNKEIIDDNVLYGEPGVKSFTTDVTEVLKNLADQINYVGTRFENKIANPGEEYQLGNLDAYNDPAGKPYDLADNDNANRANEARLKIQAMKGIYLKSNVLGQQEKIYDDLKIALKKTFAVAELPPLDEFKKFLENPEISKMITEANLSTNPNVKPGENQYSDYLFGFFNSVGRKSEAEVNGKVENVLDMSEIFKKYIKKPESQEVTNQFLAINTWEYMKERYNKRQEPTDVVRNEMFKSNNQRNPISSIFINPYNVAGQMLNTSEVVRKMEAKEKQVKHRKAAKKDIAKITGKRAKKQTKMEVTPKPKRQKKK